MRKRTILPALFILFSVFLAGCGGKTIKQERDIILNIDTDVTPSISSSFGEGEYDVIKEIYKLHIPYIKDVYIYFSCEGLETKTVLIKESEFIASVVEKDITYKKNEQQLTVDVELTISGVKNLKKEMIAFNGKDYINYKYEKNKIYFSLLDRDKDYIFEIAIENYKQKKISLSKSDIINGIYKENLFFVPNDSTLISISSPNSLEYSIYDYKTYKEIKKGYVYNENKNIVLPLKDYLVNINSYDTGYKEFFECVDGNDLNISLGKINNDKDYFYVNTSESLKNYNCAFFNKSSKCLERNMGSKIYDCVLFYFENNELYYLDDFSNCINGTDFVLNKGKVKVVPYKFDICDYFTKKTIETITQESSFNDYSQLTYSLGEGLVTFKSYKLEPDTKLKYELLITDDEKITKEIDLNYYLLNNMYTDICNVSGTNYIYSFPIFDKYFKQDEFNSQCFIYEKGIEIDKNNPAIEIYFTDDNQNIFSISGVIINSKGFEINGCCSNSGHFYYKLEEGNYTSYFNGKTLEFNVTKEDIQAGRKVIGNDINSYFTINNPFNYEIISQSNNIIIDNLGDGKYKVCIYSNDSYLIEVSNGHTCSMFSIENGEVRLSDDGLCSNYPYDNKTNTLTITPFFCKEVNYSSTLYGVDPVGKVYDKETETEYNVYKAMGTEINLSYDKDNPIWIDIFNETDLKNNNIIYSEDLKAYIIPES